MTRSTEEHEVAFRRDPSDAEAFAALRREYKKSGAQRELAALYERHAAGLRDDRRSVELLWRAAQAYAEIDDEAAELRALQKAQMQDASHRSTLERLAEIYESHGSAAELLRVLQQQVELLERHGEKKRLARLHRRLGELWEQVFSRLDRAIEHHQAAFRIDPENTEAIEAGRRIYEAVGRWQTVAQLYQVELGTVHEARRKVELLLEQARLLREKLGDLEAAARAYNEALQIRPGEEQVMEALGEIYASPEWPNPGGLDKAAAIFMQIAQRRQSRGDRDQAIAYLRRALGADPENATASNRLERAYQESGRWEDLDRLYRQRLSVATELEAVELQLRRGELLERKLGDRKGARECYETVLEREPIGGPAEARLRDQYRAEGDFPQLLALLQRSLGATKDRVTRIRLMLEMALVHRDELNAPETAAQLLHEILIIDPNHRKALAAYEDFFRQKGDYRNLADLLRFAAKSAIEAKAPPTQICARLEELAEVSERKLGDLPGAVEAWRQIAELHHDVGRAQENIRRLKQKIRHFREVAGQLQHDVSQSLSPGERLRALRRMAQTFHEKQIDPLRTVEVLREVLSEDPNDDAALRMLVDIYEREADDEGLAWALQQQLEGILTRPERLRILRRLADLFVDRLERPHDAIVAFEQLIELAPQDATALDKLQALLEQSDDLEHLARLLERRAQSARSTDDRVHALRDLARLMDQRLEVPPRAAGCWEAVLDLLPDDEEALEALARIYEQMNRAAERFEVLRRQLVAAGAAAPAGRARLLREMARTAEQLERHDDALDALEELSQVLPADRDTLESLTRIYTEQERFGELVDVLARRVDLAEDAEERLALAFRQVDLLEEKLNDPEGAVQIFERIISEIAPGDLDAHRRLRQLHLRRGDFLRACEIGERELFLWPPDDGQQHDRLELAREIADLWWERLHDADRAVVAYERVLELAPDDGRATAALRRLYHRTAAYPKLVELAPTLFATLDDDRERQVLLFEQAETWETHLADPEQAFNWYRRAFDLYPGDGSALAQLQRMAQQYELWEEMLAVYEESRKRAADATAVLEISERMATIADEQLGDAARAFGLLQDALSVDPAGHVVLPRLERLAARVGLYDELLDAFRRIAGASSDRARRHEILLRSAELARETLHAPGRALEDRIRVFEELDAAEAAAAAELVDAIEELAAESDRWGRAVYVHQLRLYHSADDAQRLQILGHVARLLEHQLDAPARAYDALLHAFMIEPDDEQLVQHLWRLAQQLTETPPAEGASLGLFDDDEEEVEEIELGQLDMVEVRAPTANVDAGRRPLADVTPQPPPPLRIASQGAQRGEPTIELGQTEVEIVDGATVVDSAAVVSTAEPRPDATVKETARAHPLPTPPPPDLPPWQRLAAAYEALPAGDDPAVQLERRLQVARMWIEGAGDVERAFEALTDAAAFDLHDRRALEQLEQLADSLELHERLGQAYDDLIEHAAEAETLIALHLRAGALLRRTGNTDAAEQHLSASLTLDRANDEAVAALRRLYTDQERWDDLATLLERQLQIRGDDLDDEQRAARLLELADLHEQVLDRPYEAAGFLANLVRQCPDDGTALERLAALYERLSLWPKLVEIVEQLLSVTTDAEARAALHLRAARVFRNELELPHRAIESYQRALAEAPRSLPALDALQQLYEQHGQPEQLVSVLQQRITLADDEAANAGELRELLLKLAKVLEEEDRLEEAAAALGRARETVAGDADVEEALARVLVRGGQTDRAVALLEDQVQRARDEARPADAVAAMLVRLARLRGQQLGDEDGCLATLEQALELAPAQREALAELAEMRFRRGDWPEFVDATLKLAEHIAADEAGRAAALALLLRAGDQLLEAGEAAAASTLLERALTLDPQHVAAIDRLLLHSPDAERKLDLLQRKLEVEERPRMKARLLVEVGRLRAERGDTFADVAPLYQEALELEPDLVPALDALSALLVAEGRIEPARVVLEEAISRLKGTPQARKAGALYFRLGRLFEGIDRDEDGYRQLMDALRLQPKNLAVRLAVGHNRFRAHRWREALRHLSAAIEHPEAQQHATEVAEALYCAGQCERRLRRPERAPPLFQAAIDFDPEHEEALKELSAAALDQGRVQQAADLLVRLARATAGTQQRIAILGAVAEIFRDRLDQRERAADCYEQLLELLLASDDEDADGQQPLLREMLPLLRELGRHLPAASAARALAAATDDRAQRIELLLAAATELVSAEAWAEADACREEVLGYDRHNSSAALGLAHSLEAQGRPQAVVQLLERHLELVREHTPDARLDADDRLIRADIYRTLGRVHRGLGNSIAAAEALEAMLPLREDEAVRHALAELYRELPERGVAALANHRVLARNIDNVDSLRELAAASAQSAPYRAYCLYRTLEAMGELDDPARSFLEGYQPPQLDVDGTFAGEITDGDRLALLTAAGADVLREVFSTLWDAAPALLKGDVSEHGVTKENRVSPVERSNLAKVFSAAARALGVKATSLYRRSDDREPKLELVAMARPALIVNRSLGETHGVAQLRFVIGRALEMSQPGFILAAGMERRDFARLLTAVLRAFHPRHMRRPGLAAQARQQAEELKRALPYKVARRLGDLFRERPQARFNSAAWRRAAQMSANRVGLVLSGELDVALAQLREDAPELAELPTFPDAARRSPLVRDLLTFAASDAYYVCRVKLGLAGSG